MNKINIFFILIVFYATLITSFSIPNPIGKFTKRALGDIVDIPIREVTKRAPVDNVGNYTQCAGTYPITFTEASYTPAIWQPGKNVTEHFVGDSTVPIEDGTTVNVEIYLKDGNIFLFSSSVNYCINSAEPCPIPAGHFDKTHEWKLEKSPYQPKGVTIDYFMNSTLVSKDKTVLACLEGTFTIKYP
nr:11657_t:CDS:2 [Entrophospora candida]